MSVIDECGPVAASAGRGSNPGDARTAAWRQSILTRWSYAAALIVGLSILLLQSSRQNQRGHLFNWSASLPQIERAQALAPEAKEAINQLIARLSALSCVT